MNKLFLHTPKITPIDKRDAGPTGCCPEFHISHHARPKNAPCRPTVCWWGALLYWLYTIHTSPATKAEGVMANDTLELKSSNQRVCHLCTHWTGLNVKGTERCTSTWAWKLTPTITIVTLIFFGSDAQRLMPIFKVELLLFYKKSHNNTIQWVVIRCKTPYHMLSMNSFFHSIITC